jgi:hypothetical protein
MRQWRGRARRSSRPPLTEASHSKPWASADGLSLVYYTGSDASQITVNGEIEKLASNIGQARDFAGIHWRSDYEWGLRLGEAAALSLLRDQSNIYAGENFEGFQITTFDGDRITVRGSLGSGADAAPGPVSVIWLVDAHCHILPHREKGPDRWRRCR